MKKIWFSLISGWLFALAATNAYAVAGFSEVNNALFDSAHMKNIKQPGTLHYEFKRHSFTGGDRKDTVDVVVSNIRNTGRVDTHFDFFTGKYKQPYQDRDDQQGNSVFVYYLEYDIHEMNKLTGGDWHYFQRKIRWAFAAGGEKKNIMIKYKGKQVPATQYIIQPYANDPKNSRYKLFAHKYYMCANSL